MEKLIKYVEVKEAYKKSAGRLFEAEVFNSPRSQYRWNKQHDLRIRQFKNIGNKKENSNYYARSGRGKNAPPKSEKSAALPTEKHATTCIDQIILHLCVAPIKPTQPQYTRCSHIR